MPFQAVLSAAISLHTLHIICKTLLLTRSNKSRYSQWYNCAHEKAHQEPRHHLSARIGEVSMSYSYSGLLLILYHVKVFDTVCHSVMAFVVICYFWWLVHGHSTLSPTGAAHDLRNNMSTCLIVEACTVYRYAPASLKNSYVALSHAHPVLSIHINS